MANDGKVASLFVEFRATVDKFAGDIRQMLNEVRSFDAGVRATQKTIADLGHLGTTIASTVVSDIGRLSSGLNTANTFVIQAQKSFVDLGHFGSAAVRQINSDLGQLTAGLNTVNTHIAQTAAGISNIGHLGSAAINQVAVSTGGLVAALNTANTHVAQTATGISNLGHLGSAAVNQVAVSTGGLVAALNTANTHVAQTAAGINNLGHLGNVALNQATTSTSLFSAGIQRMSANLRQFERTFYPIARVSNQIGVALSLGLTAPIVAAGAFALKTGISFETAFAGVRKTVQGTETELAALRSQLIELSKAAPVTAAQIAQAAGELGIKTPDIARFAQTIAELKATTRLTADEAANFLGRFSNITQLDPSKLHNLASTLVALGHGFAASEAEIAAFSLRIARVGSFVGLSQADILAFSAALASVGVTAEAGGTAISRVFADIDKAVLGNTAKLAQFASVAKQSTASFAESFKKDPSAAVAAFVDGLKKIREEGGNVFTTLDALKLSNVRVRDTLLALSEGIGQLTNGLSVSRNEFEKDGELTRAYGERNKTTASQLKILRDQVEALGISLFDTLAPAINNTIIPAMQRLVNEGIKPLIDGFGQLPGSTQGFVLGMLGLAAVIGPALLVITKLVGFFGEMGVILSKPLGILAGLKNIFGSIATAASAAAGAGGIGAFITAITAPLAVPWWLVAGTYGALVLEVYNLATAFSDLVNARDEAFRAQVGADNAVFAAIDALKKRGFDIDVKGKTIEDLRQLVTNIGLAEREAYKLGTAFKDIKQVNVGKFTGLSAEELAEQAKAAEALAKEQAKLIEKFRESLSPANALNKELDFLLQHFSADQVVAVYAKQIVDAAEAQSILGGKVVGATARLLEQARAAEKVTQILKELAAIDVPTTLAIPLGAEQGPRLPDNEIKIKALKGFEEARKQIEELGRAINDLSFLGASGQIESFGGSLAEAAKSANAFKISLPSSVLLLIAQKQAAEQAAAGLKAWEDAAHSGLKTVDEMAVQISATNANVQEMADAGFADAQILDILGDAIDKAAENARILGIELDPVIAALKKMRDEMKKTEDEAKGFAKILNKVTAEIVNDLASGIANALTGSKSFGDLGRALANDFAKAFIRTAVSEIAGNLTAKLQTLMKAHPVIAAVAAAVIIAIDIVKILGNTHLFANQFVKDIENPFGKSLTKMVDGANKLYAAGRQTYQGAQEAQTKVQEMWQSFLDDTAEFAKQGRKQATVAQQAIESLTPTFTRVIFGIQEQIEQLKPPSVRAIEFTEGLAKYRAGIAALTEERIASLNAEAEAINDQIQFTMAQIAAQEDMGGSTAELNRQLQELIYQWDAVQDALHPVIPELFSFAEAVRAVSGQLVPDKTEAFLASVLDATSGAANLEEALGILEQIGTPVAIIMDRLGSDIEDFFKALELSGVPIPELIQKYHNLANVTKNTGNEIPKIANSLSKLVGDAVDKLRDIAGGGDLAQGILDALARLLTGLPAPGTTTTSPVKDAVDKLTGVAQSMLVKLTEIAVNTDIPTAADIAAPDFKSGAGAGVLPGEPGWLTNVPNPVVMQVNISIADNEVITNQFTFSDAIGRSEVRNSVIPEITEALTNNTDSAREKWIKILGSAWNGVVTK